MQKQITIVMLFVIGTVLSPSFLSSGQISVAQMDNATQIQGDDNSEIITPMQQNSNQTFVDENQSGSNNITNILFDESGLCSLDDNNVLHCGLSENTTGSSSNIILDESAQTSLPSISTSFRVNQINETESNNVAVVYSLIDEPAEKYAGINIFNNSVYAIFYNVNGGLVNNDPQWPGQITDLTWTPGTLFNMSVLNQNDSIDLVINGTTYYSQPADRISEQPGYVGLYYGVIDSIDFYTFKNVSTSSPHITLDSVTLLLEDYELPEGSYMHLYDSTPYLINSGHVAMKVPCNDDNSTSVLVLMGQAPALNPVDLDFVAPLSTPGELCLYHGDISSSISNPVTDIAIQNNSTEDDIEFPATSSVVISVSEISKNLE